MTTSIEEQLFQSANSYYQGATILMLMKPSSSTVEGQDLLVQPAVTCAALSLKLYLKCLLVLEGSDKDDELNQIAALFEGLSENSRSMILRKFDEMSNTALSSNDLMTHLKALDNAFGKWRFILEKEAQSINLEDLEEMVLAAKATILTLKPDWE